MECSEEKCEGMEVRKDESDFLLFENSILKNFWFRFNPPIFQFTDQIYLQDVGKSILESYSRVLERILKQMRWILQVSSSRLLANFINLGIIGESYARKYVPVIGYYILQQNSQLLVSQQMNLGGVAVLGAGHLVPADQALSSQAMIEDWVLERGLFGNDFRGYL
ncbi:hypothetical protein HHK36_031225 [Tetracentron sinense]|uniref:Uncharacterized protein n=1 Tax=Tetracentron sinense TaxID=13715 RepID=A0A834YCH3_TETSI|nr:hypothetical protein HHK36_031225 [Tetracentron sinense]